MRQPDPICPICTHEVAAGASVLFDHGETVHLGCYPAPGTTTATLIWNFVASRPSEYPCYTCLALRFNRVRHDIEKAATALRATKSIVVEPAICSTCDNARATVRLGQEARPISA
jgi:hypothetical protein